MAVCMYVCTMYVRMYVRMYVLYVCTYVVLTCNHHDLGSGIDYSSDGIDNIFSQGIHHADHLKKCIVSHVCTVCMYVCMYVCTVCMYEYVCMYTSMVFLKYYSFFTWTKSSIHI